MKADSNKIIEKHVADTILQRRQEIVVGGKTFTVTPPSIATLILLSAKVAQLPKIDINAENIIQESLAVAKDFKSLAEIGVIMILGAKEIERATATTNKERCRLFNLFKKTSTQPSREIDALTEELLQLAPREFSNLISNLLSSMQIDDFFALTTFLSEVNLLRPTKVVKTETTASGQQ